MENRRTGGLTKAELEDLAQIISEHLAKTHIPCQAFTEEEVQTIRSFVQTKKQASKLVLILLGTLFIWALKDLYEWIQLHLLWGK